MCAGNSLGVSQQLIVEMINLRLRWGAPTTLRERLQDQHAILVSLYNLGLDVPLNEAMAVIAPAYAAELARRSPERKG